MVMIMVVMVVVVVVSKVGLGLRTVQGEVHEVEVILGGVAVAVVMVLSVLLGMTEVRVFVLGVLGAMGLELEVAKVSAVVVAALRHCVLRVSHNIAFGVVCLQVE